MGRTAVTSRAAAAAGPVFAAGVAVPFQPEALERRALMSMTLQYYPTDAKGGVGSPVTYQYDPATGGEVVDAGVDVKSLFDTGFVAASGIEAFLRIDGIQGESIDDKHPQQIEIESFSWAGDAATGGGSGTTAGAPRYSSLRFVSRVSKASPLLMDRLARGAHIASADLGVTRAGSTTGDEFYHVDLEDVLVSSYRITTAADGAPAEEFTLAFGDAVLAYRPLDAKGGLGLPVTARWTAGGIETGGGLLPDPPLRQPSLLDEGYTPPPQTMPMFLRLDGIQGESTDDKHRGEIEVESFSWGATHTATTRAGVTTFSELRFVSRTNKASPLLMQHMASGKHIANGDFSMARTLAVGGTANFYQLDFSDVTVNTYHVSTAPDGTLQEEFTLVFTAAANLQYTPVDAKGGVGTPVTFRYDLLANGARVTDPGVTETPLLDVGYAPASAVDVFLRIDEIKGDSADGKHPEQIEIESFSWLGDAMAASGTGTGGGRPRFSDLRFVSRVNKASPLLMDRLARGVQIPNADLGVRRGFDTPDFYTVDLNQVQVSSYRVTTASDGTPLEEFTLSFGSAALSYRPQDAKGGLGLPVTAQWTVGGETGNAALPTPVVRQPSPLNEGYAPPPPGMTMYLRLDGIEGEAISKGHEKQIEVESFSWGATHGAASATRLNPPRFSELRFVSRTGKHSPLLMQNLAQGKHLANGDFFMSRTSPTLGVPLDFYRLDFGDVAVSAYNVSTAADGTLKEEFTLRFADTSLQYYPIDAKGGLGTPVGFQFNLAAAAAQVLDAGVEVRSLLDNGFTAASGLDVFLRLDGIEGESTDDKHPKQIEIESFSWAGDATPPQPGAQTGGPLPQFSDLRFVSRVNKASPLLMDRLAKGALIPSAELAIRRAGALDTSVDPYTIDLSAVRVSSYQVRTALDGTLLEEFTLAFNDAVTTYRPQDAKGGLGLPVAARWQMSDGDGTGGTALPGPAPRQPSLLNEGYSPPSPTAMMFLRLHGIEGDSTSRGHEKQIEIESFSWGASAAVDPRGIGTGPSFSELRFVSRTGKYSPLLMQNLAQGKHLSGGNFYVARSSPTGGPLIDYYRLDFTDFVVSSYHVTTAHDGSMKEEFTLHFDPAGEPPPPPPPPPQLGVSDVTVVEGTGTGTTSATFTVSLSGAAAGTVTVNWATANGTAAAGADFTGASGVLTFLAGETSKTVGVAVARDFLDEPNETFFVNLSAPAGATIGDGQGVGTITDDDEPPPVVTQVYVASRSWRPQFLQALAAGGLGHAEFGYAVPAGPSQLRVLPWQNIDRVTVRFDKAVQIGEANLFLGGVNAAGYGHAGFEYDEQLFTATLDLKQVVRNDKLLLVVAGVTGAGGAPLDGEWQNPAPTAPADAYPSGDGTPGGTFHFRFNALAGDGNGDGKTNALDVVELRRRVGQPASGRGYSPFYDFSGDGTLNVWDLVAGLRNFNQALPQADPQIPPPPTQVAIAAARPLRGRPVGRSLFGETPVLT